MVIVVDDIVLLPLAFAGIEPLPNYFTIVFNALHKQALEEMYPLEKIQNAIKENRMEYELGELSKEKYEKATKELNQKLNIAKKVKEMNLGVRTNIMMAR
ncbi:MAG: hypothetical protein AABX63_00210 [Nanoarchaeota archaeon]